MAKKTVICTTCGTEAPPKKVTPGSFLIEIVLWLCAIVPGLIYSIWRSTHKREQCATCKSEAIVPSDSPAAESVRKRFS